VLSCDGGPPDGPDAGTTRAVLTAIARGGGTVVLDLPRHPTPAREQALALTDRLVAVVPADVRAVLAARRVLAALERVPPRTELVVRAAHPGLPAVEVSRALGLPLAGVFADDQSVRAAGATGAAEDLLTGALERLCGDVLAGPADTRRAA
jgi:Flp pilus assembly CpaE family ATPase